MSPSPSPSPSPSLRSPALLSTAAVLALAAACASDVAFPPTGGTWAEAPVPAWASQPRFAVTDNGDNTLAFVSTDVPPKLLGMRRIGDIPVELEGPHHLAASRDGKFVYVALSNYVPGSGSGPHGSHGLGTVPGALLKLRARDLVKVGEAVVDKNPGDVITNRDGTVAYVSHYDLVKLLDQVTKGLPAERGFSTVAVIDTASMARPPVYPVCAAGHGMALSSDEKTLYVACAQTDELGILDLTTHAARRLAVGPGPGKPLQPRYVPYTITRVPADGSLWLSCNGAKDGWSGVRVYDPAKGAMDDARAVPLEGIAMFSAVLSDGKTLVVPHQGDDKLTLIDTTTSARLGDVALRLNGADPSQQACESVHAVYVTPDDAYAYAVCEGDHRTRPGTVVAVSLHAMAIVGYVQVGLFPDGIAPLPPG